MKILVVLYGENFDIPNCKHDICIINVNKFNKSFKNIDYTFYNELDINIISNIIYDVYPTLVSEKTFDTLKQIYIEFFISSLLNIVIDNYTNVVVCPSSYNFNSLLYLKNSSTIIIKEGVYVGNIFNIQKLLNLFFDINLINNDSDYLQDHMFLLKNNALVRNIKVKHKWVVYLFGVIGRSIKYTIHSFEKNVFSQLSLHDDIDFDIIVINNNVDNTFIDNMSINNDDYKLINYDNYIELNQQVITKYILKKYPNFKVFLPNCSNNTALNAMRQFYLEYTVSRHIDPNIYSKAIVLCSDLFFIDPIPIQLIKDSSDNEVIVSSIYSGRGITNGFYMGDTLAIKKLLNHFPNLDKMKVKRMKNFEFIIRLSSEFHNVSIHKIPFRFLKIRANKNYNTNAHKRGLDRYHTDIWNEAIKYF